MANRDIPFREAMQKLERLGARAGCTLADLCMCARLGMSQPHLCSQRYSCVEIQLNFEDANVPPYPHHSPPSLQERWNCFYYQPGTIFLLGKTI